MNNLIDKQEPIQQKNGQGRMVKFILGCLLIFSCFTCFILFLAGGYITFMRGDELIASFSVSENQLETILTPSASPTLPHLQPAPRQEEPKSLPPTFTPSGQNQPPLIIPSPTSSADEEILDLNQAELSLLALLKTNFPARDYFDGATRLGKVDVGPRTVEPLNFELGDLHTFSIDEGSREAQLMAVTEFTYFWVETSLLLEEESIIAAASRFEKEFYPGLDQIFGSEWRPGVDNDSRFSILHLDGYGDDTDLGFFNSGDEYPRSINRSSNEQEIIYLNMRNLTLGEDLYFGTLVHEYQHLVQWNADHNESIWFNEGLAQFAELYSGLDTVDSDLDYWSNPDIQLNSWDYDNQDDLFAHYGAAYLFVVYFWEQLGDAALRDLTQHKANGMAAVRQILAKYQPELSLEQFLADWALANYLDVWDNYDPYRYANLQLRRPIHSSEISTLPFEVEATVNQFATDYIQIKNSGPITIGFVGDSSLPLFEAESRGDGLVWFVPTLDEINATLEASVDLRTHESAILHFKAWFDLEEDYDFAYLSISSDGGQTWDLLKPVYAEHGEYGPAFGGKSINLSGGRGGWVNERISISDFAGQQIIIRFDVLTASASLGTGFALDDIQVTVDSENAANLVSETDWQSNGFVRTGHHISQQWQIRLIPLDSPHQIISLPLDDLSSGQWQLDLGQQGGVLVITALTPFVSSPANYRLNVQ